MGSGRVWQNSAAARTRLMVHSDGASHVHFEKRVVMKPLLILSRAIDALNTRVGRATTWLVLVMVLISAGNAISRKAFDLSSNAFLEIQWYLFAAVFLVAAGYTYLRNEHVRIDILNCRRSRRAQVWVDLIGALFFLLPLTVVVLYFSVPYFWNSWQSQEFSSNPGGLIIWPAKALIPLGFALLLLQAVSEIIKALAFLRGVDAVVPAHLAHLSRHGVSDEVETPR